MTIERLREVHSARPFRPFVLVMADGSRIPVRQASNLAHGGGKTASVIDLYDSIKLIDLPLVASIEDDSRERNGIV